ncbi:helix-turn-helix transcriptional regulator [Dictyobacter formicarum]|uniref:Tetratricopeptide repeat protein n=1 Tax=Dictyobacter formicarum TaxID=2778368 RepID=A0ABQ3VNW4_9CHLR|nr:helix-turn-helix transcriptional regulator [Dictyobacter formicarum]GHO87379.1 tetratricopeptide repeat protein [Dictyobacter formicarum]
MTKTSYREQDHTFGQQMLALRMATGLTQAELGKILGVSRHTVGAWEAGESYPKAEHLKAFIRLLFEQQGFQAGSEEEQIRALWRSAHQKVLLDEPWLKSLLEQQVVPLVSTLTEEKDPPPAIAEQLRLWTVPYARNPHFTGREELLDQLTQHFQSQDMETRTLRHVALTQTQVLKGLGGIGKTQTAIEYAYRSREQERYTHTLWIAAASEEVMIASFTSLAARLPELAAQSETDPYKLMLSVKRWLEQCHDSWLLIVDNADDLALVQPYLPIEGNGCLLFTTRASAVGNLASAIDVETMGLLEGAHLLLRRAHLLEGASDDLMNDASSVVAELGQFPLAIDQAGAYIEETRCSINDYLLLYRQHRHRLLARRGLQMTGYPDSVATTWELSFRQVERMNSASAELLHLCALLAPDRIPEELLEQGSPYWPPALQEATADLFSFNQLIEPLLAFSLVKRLSTDRQLSIHRLVQAVQLGGMSPQEQRQWSERLVRALNASFPEHSDEPNTWPQCMRYLEQVQVCDVLIEHHHLQFPEAADLLDRAGSYFLEHFMPGQAEPLYRRALAIREQQWGGEHPQTASSLYHLATLYRANSDFAQAEPLFERALAIRQQQLGAEHLETAACLHGLASLYESQRRTEKGEVLARRALDIYEQQLGADDLETTPVRRTLALLYMRQERLEVAEALFQHNLAICERQLGPEHPQTATTLNGLAFIYVPQGRYQEAERYYRRVLAIREKYFGPTHYQTALVIYNLGNLYREQGRYEEAEPLAQQALALYEQHLGPQHVYLADSFIALADILWHLGKYPQAEELARQALDLHEAHLSPVHEYIAKDLTILGAIYREQGRYVEAEPLFQRALQINVRRLLGSIIILYEFALLREAQGQDEQAYALHQQALAACQQVGRTETHPEMLAIRQHLATLQRRLGRPEDAASRGGMQTLSAYDGAQAGS